MAGAKQFLVNQITDIISKIQEMITGQTNTSQDIVTGHGAKIDELIQAQNLKFDELIAEQGADFTSLINNQTMKFDGLISEMQASIAKQDLQIAELGEINTGQSTQITKLTDLITKSNTQISSLSSLLTKSDTQILKIGEMITAQENTMDKYFKVSENVRKSLPTEYIQKGNIVINGSEILFQTIMTGTGYIKLEAETYMESSPGYGRLYIFKNGVQEIQLVNSTIGWKLLSHQMYVNKGDVIHIRVDNGGYPDLNVGVRNIKLKYDLAVPNNGVV